MTTTCEEIFAAIHPDYYPYYRSWCHDFPIVITPQRDAELHELQRLLYLVSVFYVQHYRDYLNLIPFDEKVLAILEYAEKYPFRAGTFRPDYVVREDGGILVCEITSRFFGNGYFMSHFMEKAGESFAEEAGITDQKSYFSDFFEYMGGMASGLKRLVVLKSADKSDSIKLYVPFYRALGLETTILEAYEVEKNIDLFQNSMLVSALNQADLLSYSMQTLKKMADAGMRNDFRTIFLLHDKRFFHLLFQNEFTDRVLNPAETEFLQSHVIRTALPDTDPDMWADAMINKDGYILKHRCLGKSEKVYAGVLTDEAEWKNLFADETKSQMILQPFIKQKVFTGSFQGKVITEYISPSILMVDDRYFGTALFRSSSCPVINKGDAHKIAPVLTAEAEKFARYHLL